MLLGLLLVPDTSYGVCVYLYGEAGTGKSTALSIIGAYLGGPANWCSIDILTLAEKFEIGELAEKLANLVEEMPTDDPQNRIRYIEGKFKATVTGAVMQFCRKGKAPVSGRCTARHVFAVNNLPKFFDKSEGIWDRTRVIPFRVRFRDTPDQIRAIERDIIDNELPGILCFGLAGLARLRRLGRFPECAEGIAVKAAHRASCDIDRQYCIEHFEPDPDRDVECRKAYKDFCDFCEENGLARRSAPTFHAAMLRLFGVQPLQRSFTDHTRVFKGVRPTYKPDEPTTENYWDK
jgi:putative DNA primase/helicase